MQVVTTTKITQTIWLKLAKMQEAQLNGAKCYDRTNKTASAPNMWRPEKKTIEVLKRSPVALLFWLNINKYKMLRYLEEAKS